ncbi:TPA: PefC/AfrB family outer membrane usher protein [Salmonella enterica]|nr:PefC/AfrB family outer membrane usher protein [Salmonella enterica subsp. diarizonae]HDC2661438.1 PefC/AfrB family outer membrane usher protein [Salmonella enterica]
MGFKYNIIKWFAFQLKLLVFYPSFAYTSDFNTAFLHGTSDIPSALKKNVKYPAGQYYVDVYLNGELAGRTMLIVSPEDEQAGELCLSPEWLQNSGIFFNADAYLRTFNSVRSCYLLAQKESTTVKFDHNRQILDFGIPQAWLLEKNDAARWDYGINGLRLKYNGNFNKNFQTRNPDGNKDESLNAYMNLNAGLNIGRWVLLSDMNATRSTWGNEFETNSLTLSTALSNVKGDLLFGRSQTSTELFNDFGFYGAALRSNSNMRSWETRGYAPVITGVASTTSRITVTQGGYTIYSRVVPPGPYRLDDINSTSNGNLLVTVEDDGGRKTVTEYPVATLSSLLRPGEFKYNLAAGKHDNANQLSEAFSSEKGTFGLASLDWGFSTTTLNIATLLNRGYQAAGVGLTQSMGLWGAIALSINGSRAKYDDRSIQQGVSATVKYAKSFTNKTDIQLLTYRYQSPGYTEFASWDPKYIDRRRVYNAEGSGLKKNYIWFDGKEKARYEARLNHRMDKIYLSGSFWQQTYWNNNKDAIGATLSASTNILDGISLFLSGNYSRSSWSPSDEYSGSLGISIPFTLGGVRHSSSNSVGYNRYNGTSFNTSASASLNERLNYSISAGADERNNNTAGASVSYAFNQMQTNLAFSKRRGRITLSGNLSGSAIATGQTGLLLTKEASETVAVLKIMDTPGITFNGSLPTNSAGNTVLYLNAYTPTYITINPENVPSSAELLNTSYEVVPTEKAIIYREFGFQNVSRYIVRVRDAHGEFLTGGNAKTEQGLEAGFITSNGVLLMNLLAAPKTITVSQRDGKQCRINAAGLKENTGTVQEIRCE